MTPLEIEILMHYHTSPGDYRKGDFSAPAVREALSEFVKHGVLEETFVGESPRYKASDALAVYIDAICSVPLPVLRWVMPDREAAVY